MERINFRATGRWPGKVFGVAPRLPGSLRLAPRSGVSRSATRVGQLRLAAGPCPAPDRAAPSAIHPSSTGVHVWSDEQRTPQDTWCSVEDLWLRMAASHPIHVDVCSGEAHLVFGIHGPAIHEEINQLRAIAQHPAAYAWQSEGQSGSFVRSIAIEGGDLVFTVTSILTITRWPQGDDLGWQVKGFFVRLRARQVADQAEVPS